MKIAFSNYSLRGYPPRDGGMPDERSCDNLLAWAQEKGFDGIEVGDWWFDFFNCDVRKLEGIVQKMRSRGLELAAFNCLRKCVTYPSVGEKNKKDLRRAIEVAGIVHPKIVNISLSLGPDASGTPPDRVRGLSRSPGGSAEASEADFVEAAHFLAELAEQASRDGVKIAIELHHCSIADTSSSMLKLLKLADHPNLSANPDLPNLYWAYDKPKENWFEAVERLAGKVQLWHAKNVKRIYIPEVNRAFFVHAALDEGDVDYRWAMSRFIEAGFDGWISIETAGAGDALDFIERGKRYLDRLIKDSSAGAGLWVQ